MSVSGHPKDMLKKVGDPLLDASRAVHHASSASAPPGLSDASLANTLGHTKADPDAPHGTDAPQQGSPAAGGSYVASAKEAVATVNSTVVESTKATVGYVAAAAEKVARFARGEAEKAADKAEKL